MFGARVGQEMWIIGAAAEANGKGQKPTADLAWHVEGRGIIPALVQDDGESGGLKPTWSKKIHNK